MIIFTKINESIDNNNRHSFINIDKLLNSNANDLKDQEKFNEEYKKLGSHTKVKSYTEVLKEDIENKTIRKIKLERVIKAYRHSKIITEFSKDLWNGLLDKCLVFKDHIEFRWKYTN